MTFFVAVVVVSFAPFSIKIWGDNLEMLHGEYGWGYAVCYEALHVGGVIGKTRF